MAQGTQDALTTRMLMYKMMGCGALLPPVQQGRDSHPLVVGHGPTTFPQHCWAICSALHDFVTSQPGLA